MDESKNLYPDIQTYTTYSADPLITRQKYMIEKQQELQNKLNHYKKLRSKWSKADSTLKTLGVVITALSSLIAVVTTIAFPVALVPTIFSIVAGINSLLTGGTVIGLTGKKKSQFKQKIEVINNYLNKLYIFFEKSKNDQDITVDEIQNFTNIYNEFQKALESPMQNAEYTKKEIKQAKNLAKKSLEKERINQLATVYLKDKTNQL